MKIGSGGSILKHSENPDGVRENDSKIPRISTLQSNYVVAIVPNHKGEDYVLEEEWTDR